MQRFFLSPNSIVDNLVRFPEPAAHQLTSVLRSRPGEMVVVLDNSGWEYEVELTAFGKGTAEGLVRRKRLTTAEPRTKITIYQALLKGDQFETVLQKCTEIGVVGFVPVLCDRCVIASLSDVTDTRIERWRRIVQEAAEQSGRGKLPNLHAPLLFEQACSLATGLSFLPWEEERATPLRVALSRWDSESRGAPLGASRPGAARPQRPFSINVFIGPEGGFSPQEVKQAKGLGMRTVSLGPRILRAETAGLVTATAILYEWGDLGG